MRHINVLFLAFSFYACNVSNKSVSNMPQHPVDGVAEWLEKNADQVLVPHHFQGPNDLNMPYRLYTPKTRATELVPLVVFLHGRGDRGSDNGRRVYENVGLITNSRSLISPAMQGSYPCFVLIPQCSDKTINEEWARWEGNSPDTPFKGLGKDGSYTMSKKASDSGAAALALIDHILASHPIDHKRVYLVGMSMGGFGTWEFTARRPDLFAAGVPMAGFSDPDQIEKIKHIPFWIFHGDADQSNPVEGSQTMYQLLKKAGAEVKYTEYEGASHGESFDLAFDEPGLIPWLFTQRKK